MDSGSVSQEQEATKYGNSHHFQGGLHIYFQLSATKIFQTPPDEAWLIFSLGSSDKVSTALDSTTSPGPCPGKTGMKTRNSASPLSFFLHGETLSTAELGPGDSQEITQTLVFQDSPCSAA